MVPGSEGHPPGGIPYPSRYQSAWVCRSNLFSSIKTAFESHRGVARSFAVVTGSTAHDDETDLSRVAGADTLVVLMAAGRVAQTCTELVAAGRPSDEPAAIVQWAWTPDQRSVVGTLTDLPILAEAASIGPPATLVVGGVAAFAIAPGWSELPPGGVVSRDRPPATRRSHL